MITTEMIICGQADVSGAPDRVKLLPLGLVKSQKGDFWVDEECFTLMRAKFLERGNDIVIDYEHQTLKDIQAPAGGWIKDLLIEDGAIVAKVEWTKQAKDYLEAREYRYLSPVVYVRKSDKKAIVLHSAALTNTPAIDSMYPIINSVNYYEGGAQDMELLKQLAALLGMGEDATEEQILEAVKTAAADAKKRKEEGAASKEAPPDDEGKIVSNKVICDLLGVAPGAKTEDVAAAIVSLKQGGSSETEVRLLRQRLDQRDADDAVERAMKGGKLTPTLKEWATAYALKDPAGFSAFIDKAPQVVPMGELGMEASVNKDKGHDEATLLVCKQLGISSEDLVKYGAEG